MHAKCMICNFDVAVINCHYICTNCGFTANWDEGSDPSFGYDKKDKTLLINILDEKETDGKWKKSISKYRKWNTLEK